MSFISDVKEDRAIAPKYSLAILVVLVSLITTVSLAIFWNSDTKELVKVLQQTGRLGVVEGAVSEAIVDDGTLTTGELQFILDESKAVRDVLAPESDFGGSELDGNLFGL